MLSAAPVIRFASICVLLVLVSAAPRECGAEDALTAGLDALAQGNNELAATKLAEFVAESITAPADNPAARDRLRRGMIGAGQALRHLGRYAEALEFFDSALGIGADEEPNGPLRLAAAECAHLTGDHRRAWESCDEILGVSNDPSIRQSAQRLWIRSKSVAGLANESWQALRDVAAGDGAEPSIWLDLAKDVGLSALSHDQPTVAMDAFQWYLRHAPADVDAQTVHLGIAWAAAKGAESYESAAARLVEFIERYPHSPHIPKAMWVCGGCYRRCGRPAEATEMFRRLTSSHPDSPEATSALAERLTLAPDALLGSEDLQLIKNMLAAGADSVAGRPALVAAALVAAAEHQDEALWLISVESLIATPAAQETLTTIYRRLEDRERMADAERLATYILGGNPGAVMEPAIECTCRWAAGLGQWTMLGQAARSERLVQAMPSLSSVSNRLLAEGAIQSGQMEVARGYLDHLIGQAGVHDFDVLVRRAEVAFVLESQDATQLAISRASEAATNGKERSLVDMLRAQLAIRAARFDEARVTLEQIIRGTEAVADLKARAQWLVGETHLQQRNYSKAVEAYRIVESLDTSGNWTAAALVQAGRAFEQLGRPRDAAICYTGLLRRFANSPHTDTARNRLASLQPTSAAEAELR